MSIAPNFNLLSELARVLRRDFPLANPDLLSPHNSNPLIDGEWLQLDANRKLARGSGEAAVRSYPLFAERGRYDTQAIGKAPVLFLGPFEAETTVFDATGLSVGDFLAVGDVTIDSLTRRGLIKATGTGNHFCVGHVTAVTSTKLTFVHEGPFSVTLA